jgi:flagellar biogenesis protein FliO
MSFPISPSNNQIALVNGIEYYYHSTKGAWYRYGDGSANVITSNTFQVLSSIIFSDGTSQTSAASPTDSYARTTANTATNNITILQGVNTDQNTRITIVEGVDVGQNTRMSIIEGVDTTQNTNITISTNAATAAFAQANATAGGLTTANSRITIAEGVDLAQNTRMDIIEGVNTTQNTRITISEGVDVGQNTRMTIIEGVDATQNTNITVADTKAQAAFDKANSAYTLANTANAAAGSGGSSLTSFTTTVDTFTGNGSQTQFTLSTVPGSEDNTFLFLNGVYQEKGTYSVVGANVILTGTATANDTIEVTTVAGSVMNVSVSAYSTRIYQGNGSTNTFTISAGHTANTIMVFNNGVCQFPGDDYTVSGTTLTYVLTPEPDETIQIREMPTNSLVPLTQPVMRRYTANGAQTQFTVTLGQTANTMFVYENGICQVPVNDYTVSNTTLTFTTAPLNNVVVQIREMSF